MYTAFLIFLNICGDYAAYHIIAFNCNKIFDVRPKKYKQPAPSRVFMNGVHVEISEQVKYLGVYITKYLTEGWQWCPETSEITVLCSKQAQRHLCSVFICSKKHSILCLLHANACLPIVEQMQTNVKLLWVACKMPIELRITYPEM